MVEVTREEQVELERLRRLPQGWRDAISMVECMALNTIRKSDDAARGQWMTYRQVMDYTGYSRSGIDSAARSGKLPRHKQDGMSTGYRFRRDEVDKWMERRG